MDLSVVIIGLNEEASIHVCIEAAIIAANEVGGAEIVYVDSHSTDNTIGIVNKYDIRVEMLDPGLRRSPSAARSFASTQVTGEYILFLDADTIVYTGYLSRALEDLRRDPSLAGVNGWIDDTSETGEPVHGLDEHPVRATDTMWLRGPCCLYRRSALLAVGGFDPDLATEEEAELGLRLIRAGWKLSLIPVPMAKHTRCYHPTSLRRLATTFIRDLNYGRLGEVTKTALRASHSGNGIAFCWLRLKTTILFLLACLLLAISTLSPFQPAGRYFAVAFVLVGLFAVFLKKGSLSPDRLL
jgi:GT2 family glycosyltransferase